MPLITVTAGTPAIPAGTYPATLIGIAEKSLVTKFSKNGEEQDFLEWTWLVEAPDKDVEITSLTSVATGPKSRIFEYLTALLGAGKVDIGLGLDEKDLVGKQVNVSTVVTEDGFAKIDQIVAPVTRRTSPVGDKPVEVAPKADKPADDDDLPF